MSNDNGKTPMGAVGEPLTVDTGKPYLVMTWDDTGQLHQEFGGGIVYDHLIVASFMAGRLATAFVDAMMSKARPADNVVDIETFQGIPDDVRQR